MLLRERHVEIEKLVRKNNIILIGEIAEKFNVSLETARRDLETLQDMGIVRRIHGGAVLRTPSAERTPSTTVDKYSSYTEKKAIGQKAASLVRNGETIFLGTGSTALEMARNLKTVQNLTVVTNSIMIVNELITTNITVIVLGGTLKNIEQVINSHATVRALKDYYVDKSFFSCAGISESSITDYGDDLSYDLLAAQTQSMILLADSRKFGHQAKFKVGDLDILDKIVTDCNIGSQHLKMLHKYDIEVVLAPVPEDTDDTY